MADTTNIQLRLCVVTSPRTEAAHVPLSNLVSVLSNLSDNLHLITGNAGAYILKENTNIQGYSLEYLPKSNPLARIIANILMQLRISYTMFKIRNSVGAFIFFMFDGLLLPVLTAKLTRRRVILSLASTARQYYKNHTDRLAKVFIPIESLCFFISDKIIVYSPNLVKLWDLERYKDKISIAHEHFLNLNELRITEPVTERQKKIGYIGRFSHEKGTMNFVKAISVVLRQENDCEFFIGGDGELQDEMKEYLDGNHDDDNVYFNGWIAHEKLPSYLNKLKLLVLPSNTEGLPNIMLEAMACGTPVLATAVGVIPDIIKDGKTGFIMEDNSPNCIAKNISRALNHPNLEEITNNARAFVEAKFTHAAAVNEYKRVLND